MGGRKNTRMICGFSIQRSGRGKRENHLGQGQIQDVAKLLPGWVIESSSLVAPPLTMDHLSTSPLNSWRFYLTKKKIRLASWWTTTTSTFWIWLPPSKLLPWWLSTSTGSVQRVSPAPFLRKSFICQPAMWSANLYELWKVFQLVDNRSSLYCYKTSLCRPHFSITLWVLVNSEHPNSPYLCLLVCHHKKWQTEATMRPVAKPVNSCAESIPRLSAYSSIQTLVRQKRYLPEKKVINFRRFCSYIPWNLILDLQTCLSLLLVPLS